jgi:hypothetical protein
VSAAAVESGARARARAASVFSSLYEHAEFGHFTFEIESKDPQQITRQSLLVRQAFALFFHPRFVFG